MNVSNIMATAGAILALSAGATLAAEACKCCEDMAANAKMTCCDKMKSEDPAPEPAPAPAADAGDGGSETPTSAPE